MQNLIHDNEKHPLTLLLNSITKLYGLGEKLKETNKKPRLVKIPSLARSGLVYLGLVETIDERAFRRPDTLYRVCPLSSQPQLVS